MGETSEYHEKPMLPDGLPASLEALAEDVDDKADLKRNLLAQAKQMMPIIFGLSKDDLNAWRAQIIDHAKKLIKNPGQFSEDFWDSLFGTGADGISREDDAEEKGKIDFTMDLPEPVRMPAAYSVAYHRLDDKQNEVVTLLERDEAGNIHYLDAGKDVVFVRTETGFRRYPVLAGQKGFGAWDGVLLSARSVRGITDHFWNCADQTFIKWLGVERTEDTEYLGRRCGLYHAQPGTITFKYQCDMVIDDETGLREGGLQVYKRWLSDGNSGGLLTLTPAGENTWTFTMPSKEYYAYALAEIEWKNGPPSGTTKPKFYIDKAYIEQIWKQLRAMGFRNEIFKTLDRVVDRLCDSVFCYGVLFDTTSK